jgi:hypothetical protein
VVILALLSAWVVPSHTPLWLQLSWLPVFYLLAIETFQAQAPWRLTLDAKLQLRHADNVAAAASSPLVIELDGQLSHHSLVCWLGIWLVWHTSTGQKQRRWLFRDAMAETDFRALARSIQQLRWRAGHPRWSVLNRR